MLMQGRGQMVGVWKWERATRLREAHGRVKRSESHTVISVFIMVTFPCVRGCALITFNQFSSEQRLAVRLQLKFLAVLENYNAIIISKLI